ncbi:MAG: hypothetical protein GXO70_10760 [Acidobacteria bacterium]|nr:hypothetical protein [Acidobacteriota bacterium]
MKKHIVLILFVAVLSSTACGPLKVNEMQQIGVKNHTLVMYFSRKMKHPFVLSIDGTRVPVVAPGTGQLLQIHNMKPGKHNISIVSNWYIFSQPVRDISYSPDKNETAIVFSALKYSETTRPVQEKNRPGMLKRMLNAMVFWKGKETATEKKIDTTKLYGEFTD